MHHDMHRGIRPPTQSKVLLIFAFLLRKGPEGSVEIYENRSDEYLF